MSLQKNIITLQPGLPIRHELFEGREHLVAPVVLLVEGVHNELFYPAEELAKYPDSWNGVPLPVFHPEESGKNVSANTPRLIEERSVGRLFNVRYDSAKNGLVGEVWIEIGKSKKIASQVLEAIESGGNLEVSSALFTDDDGIPGSWNGEEYIATVVNYRPDHLALLPGAEGACSWADGCGIRANVRSSARTPSFGGTETTSWANVTTSFSAYRDAYYRSHGGPPDEVPSRVQDAPAPLKNWIASKTLLGEGSADNERDLIFFPVVNPGTGKLNEGALRAVIGGRGSQAQIPAAAKRSAQNKARRLLNRYFDAELEVEASMNKKDALEPVKAFFRKLAANIGLTVQEASHEDLRSQLQTAVDALDNEGWIHFVREVYDDFVIYEARGNNPNEIGEAHVAKLYSRGYLVDDQGKVSLAEDAQEVREERKYVPVSNAPAANTQTPNQEEMEMKKKDELIKALIACECNGLTEKDEQWLKSLSEDQLAKVAINEEEQPTEKPEEKEGQKEGETPPAEPETKPAEETPPAEPKPEEKPTGNARQVTLEEFITNAPAEIRGTLRRAVANDQARKNDLVTALLANERNKFSEKQLRAMEIEDLENLTELGRIEVNYSLQGGGPGVNEDTDSIPDMPPVFDLSEKSA
ncbi:MAG TPA: hypothetical protein ENO22_05735 [candidate division Zixibacteria bacterium]|nr:hypothetical protein [candidate division Zixibacteria bacterium]